MIKRLSIRKFVVSQYRKPSCGNPSVFHNLSSIEKLYGREEQVGRTEYRVFLSETSCLTMPKNFVNISRCAVFQEISGIQKKLGIRKSV